jgi:glucose/arabinose dehydrogenase
MRGIMFVMLAFLLGACSSGGPGQDEASQPGGANQPGRAEEQETAAWPAEAEVLADNLRIPWSINKAGEVSFVSEREGAIVRVGDGGQTRQEVQLEKPVSGAAEAGLLGLVLARDFAESNQAFAYYTYEDGGQYNRIVQLTLEDDVWVESKLLLDQIPSGNVHHGGRLAIGPDGKLYATAGDASRPELAQDLVSLAGKILRLNLDGSVPDDNPFADSYVFSYGHRNPQGMVWDEDGTMFASEHGPSARDEINVIEPGNNYGWPEITGDEEKQGMESPLFHSGENTWAPSGMAVLDGKLYVAALRGSAVLEFDVEKREVREVVSGLGRIRDVMIQDDELYFISNNTDGRGSPKEDDDKLYKIPLSSFSE